MALLAGKLERMVNVDSPEDIADISRTYGTVGEWQLPTFDAFAQMVAHHRRLAFLVILSRNSG